jgi:hypothetical protein
VGERLGESQDAEDEAGSYLRLIDPCITQHKAQGPSRTCNESKKEEEEGTGYRVKGIRGVGERLGQSQDVSLGPGSRVKGTGCRVQEKGYTWCEGEARIEVKGVGYRVQGTGYRV